jgi:WD40 repeat protein
VDNLNTHAIKLYQVKNKNKTDSRTHRGTILIISVMRLTEKVVLNFRCVKTFKENTQRINSIDFSAQGDTLISSSDDESIVIYDCQSGT